MNFPLQTVRWIPPVRKSELLDRRFQEFSVPPPLSERFQLGSPVVYLGSDAWGCPGTILKILAPPPVVEQQVPGGALVVSLKLGATVPNFGRLLAEKFKENYFALPQLAEQTSLSIGILARLTSRVFVQPGRVNVGLDLRFGVVLGYTRQLVRNDGRGNVTLYSARVRDILVEYSKKFPEVINMLERSNKSAYQLSDLFAANKNPQRLQNSYGPLEVDSEEEEEEETKKGKKKKFFFFFFSHRITNQTHY